jgi:alcohol dehydrogenase class IV
MDALSQAIESYWSVRSTEESKRTARAAIRTITDHLQEAVHHPTNTSRFALAKASHLAGRAINVTRTTAPHALSYPLTSHFGVPHGQAVSLTLPHFLIFNYGVTGRDLVDQRGVAYVEDTLTQISRDLGCRTVRDASIKLQNIMRNVGLATTFAELHVDKGRAIQLVLDEMNTERLANNPRTPTYLLMKSMLDAIA